MSIMAMARSGCALTVAWSLSVPAMAVEPAPATDAASAAAPDSEPAAPAPAPAPAPDPAASPAPDLGTEPAAAPPPACVPECRAGFGCVDGQCVAVCEPACASNELCREGQCQSRCNPICAFGQVCTEAGECIEEAEPEAQEPPVREFAYELPPEPPEPRGVPMLTAGAAMVGVGLTMLFASTYWRFTLGELELDPALTQRRRRIAAGLAISGAVLAVAGVPLLVIGVQRYRDSKRQARARRPRAFVDLGRHEATVGVRMRF